MNFSEFKKQFDWVPFDGQMDSGVTYVFVSDTEIPRMVGASDILYIGKTDQSIKVRFEQETRTKNSPRNTQQTNIRMTHILGKLGTDHYRCFYTKNLEMRLPDLEQEEFIEKLKVWDKQFFLKLTDAHAGGNMTVPIEKYLLVGYTHEHLELPPLNNRL